MQIRELKEKAHSLYARGKFRKSRELYEAAIIAEPNDAQLHLKLADCCRKEGDLQGAARFFERSASILFRAGHSGRAHAALKLALELKPRDENLLSLKSEIDATRTPRPSPLMRPSVEERLDSALTSGRQSFGNSARALSLEIPIVFEEEPSEDVDLSDALDDLDESEHSAPPVAEPVVQASFVRLSDHTLAVRTGSTWTLFKSATAIREEELNEEEFAARMQALDGK